MIHVINGGRRRWRAVLQCLLLSIAWCATEAQVPQAQADSTTVVMRPWQLTDAGVARIYTELVSIADTSTYERIRVRAGQSLRGLVYERYGVGDGSFPLSNRAVRAAIASANGISIEPPLSEGQELLVPRLPYYVELPARRNVGSQIWKFNIDIADRVNAEADSSKLAVWSVALPYGWSDPRFSELLGELTPRAGRALSDAVTPPNVILEAEYPEPESADSTDFEADTDEPRPAPVAVNPKDMMLYVLDFFSQKCGHGQQVMDVVWQTLNQLGVDSAAIAPRVIAVNLDLLSDQAGKRQVVAAFARRHAFKKAEQDSLVDAFDQILETAREKARNGTSPRLPFSMLHYAALMDSILESSRGTPTSVRIVSSSFFAINNLMGPFAARSYVSPSDMVFLFNASGNENAALESITEWQRRQPPKAFYDLRQNYPYYLVGGELKRGKSYGVWSRDFPWGVPFVGRATKWGNRDSCIHPNMKGTSFATPSVAASLFGAFTLWDEKKILPKRPEQVVRRLLLSSRPTANLVGRYAAPGALDRQKLLLPPGAYVRLADGTLRSGVSLKGMIEINSAGVVEQLSGGNAAVPLWGGAFDGDEFMYLTKDRVWKQGDVVGVYLELKVDGAPPPRCRNKTADGACAITSLKELHEMVREFGWVF